MTTLTERIQAVRADWGERLFILGHHYQRPEVIRHADARGDSLELARKAAERRDAERIVFCGVRFMAESADILTAPDQAVYMPETTAGCPMADMADDHQAEQGWERLQRVSDAWVPVVYVNSSAEVKAFCGRHGGSACTSSNAGRVLKHYLDQGKRIYFLPDEHLAVNTATDLGVPDELVSVLDPRADAGGLADSVLRASRIVAWKGFCHVHTNFTLEQVERVRRTMPEARIIVHPEAPKEVIRAVDAHGSTSQIIAYVESAAPGSTVVVGTEFKLVARLADEYRDRLRVLALTPSICPNMAKTTEQNLCDLLETWPAHHQVKVPETIARDARFCLERMLAL